MSDLVSPPLRERLTALRRSIHQDPELAFQEERTAARLEEALRSIGISDIRRVAGTGVVARMPQYPRPPPGVEGRPPPPARSCARFRPPALC